MTAKPVPALSALLALPCLSRIDDSSLVSYACMYVCISGESAGEEVIVCMYGVCTVHVLYIHVYMTHTTYTTVHTEYQIMQISSTDSYLRTYDCIIIYH